jgi:hypothetical protein
MVAGNRGSNRAASWKDDAFAEQKGRREVLAFKCSNLARGESMKDPVSVLGRWRGFHFWFDGPTQGDSTCKTLMLLFLALKPPDLPIKMPDLDITPVHKLPSGLQGLRVCCGLDGFVRSHAIIAIDQVSPIRRHGVLLPPRYNARGNGTGGRGPCRNRMEPARLGSETGRKLLSGKAIIEA